VTARELALRSTTRKGLRELTQLAVDLLEVRHALLLVRRNESMGVGSAAGLNDGAVRTPVVSYGRNLAKWVERTHTALVLTDVSADSRFPDPPDGVQSVHAFPLISSGTVHGVLLFFLGQTPTRVAADREPDSALAALSHLAALALSRGRVSDQLRQAIRDLEETERELLEMRRLASVGDLILDMGREVKTPLAGLGAVARQVAETLDENDSRRSLLDVIVQEVVRLDRILGDQLELARSPEPELCPEELNRLLNECLMMTSDDMRAGKVRVTKRLGSSIPHLLLSPDLMRRVFLNMIRAGIESASPGGRIKLESKRRGETVEVLLTADGGREPGHVLDNLWKPFRVDDGGAGDVTASGIKRILREHGGVLRVSATRDWPLVFSLVLPIPGNEDRRQGPGERRTERERRRA
jgi:signal transduction histidine kinase